MGRILHDKFIREASKILEKYLNLFTIDYKKYKDVGSCSWNFVKKIKKQVGWIYYKTN